MPTPSGQIVDAAHATLDVTDSLGRTIAFRRPTALDRLRLFKAVGPALADNDRYLGLAMLAACVTSIDGVPVPSPTTEQQVESLVQRLDDPGLDAVGQALSPEQPTSGEQADAAPGNVPISPPSNT